MSTVIKETFAKRGKLTIVLGIIIALYVIGVGLFGAFGNLTDSLNFFSTLGTASPVMEAAIMILASMTLASTDTRRFLGGLEKQGHHKLTIFLVQIGYLVVAYAFFMAITAGFTLAVQATLFKGANMGSFAKFNMAIYANMLHMFLACSMILFFTMLFGKIKSRLTAIATGIGVNYVGQGIAAIGMLFVYHHRMLKWEPFNFLFVENQLNKPINHTLTKLYMPQAISGSIIYALIFTFLAFCLFLIRKQIKD